jgi:hypothetical protein
MLEKPRGEMGMTWSFKVQRVAFALGVVGVMALASGADWWNCFGFWW